MRVKVFVLVVVLVILGGVSWSQAPLPLPDKGDTVARAIEPRASKFTVDYPSTARPMRIVRKFGTPTGNNPYEGVDLYAPKGTVVVAGASGVVKRIVPASQDPLGYGGFVLIKSRFGVERYKVYYGNLTEISVTVGQQVVNGQTLGVSASDHMTLVVRTRSGGIEGFQVTHVIHPKYYLRVPGLRLQPTVQNLRYRAAPDIEAPILGKVNPWDLLSSPRKHYKLLLQQGQFDKWVPITLNDGSRAFMAAWYVKVVSKRDPGVKIKAPLTGMNLDPDTLNGAPSAEPLSNLGWVRINYHVSYNPYNGTYGNTDLNAAYQRYYPIIKRYASNGNRVILVFTHQFYGEGQGYIWEQMDSTKWQSLTTRFASMAQIVAAQYASEGLVYAYQIWNEQDSSVGSYSAVSIPAYDYSRLLTASISAIKAVDPDATVITGGHISGPNKGVAYAKQVLSYMPSTVRPDGIAFHPYGRGATGSPYASYGTIDESVRGWATVMPGAPLWITEWGVLNHTGDESLASSVNDYAMGFLNVLNTEPYKDAVAAALWYAWADGMDNAYGLVRWDGSARQPLFNSFLGISALRRAYG